MNYENFVNVDNKFRMCKFQVTQKEYTLITGKNPSNFKGDNLPVEQVSLYDAMEYCNKKSILNGLNPVYFIYGTNISIDKTQNGFRLPTEEEWKYAAKGGSLSKGFTFSGSNNPDEVSWHNLNSNEMTHKTGTKQPNELGIYDMNGNVWEWVDTLSGIIFGGSWAVNIYGLKVFSGYSYNPTQKSNDIGFRVVKGF